MRLGWLAIALIAAPASAQDMRSELGRDARFQTVDYSKGNLFQIRTAPATSQTVIVDRGERIQSIVLGVPDSYRVDVGAGGDSFTLKANGAARLSILSMRTDRRTYELELVPGSDRAAPLVVRFVYGGGSSDPGPAGPRTAARPPETNWKLSGDKTLRPASIRDDGRKTYIAWPDDQALPAVFATGPGGKEEMVEGYIRAGVFTIDRVYDRLTFRIDRRAAKARRAAERGRPQS